MFRNIYHIQNYEKKIHNAKKNCYKRYVVFFSKNLRTFLDGFIYIMTARSITPQVKLNSSSVA